MSSPTRAPVAPRTALAAVLAALVALGLLRAGARLLGVAVLLGVVAGCVLALTLGVLLLKAAAGW